MLKTSLLAACALTVMASAATARTNDPGYLAYDGGAQILGLNDMPVTPGGAYTKGAAGTVGLSGAPSSLSFEGVSQYDTRAINGGFSFIPPDSHGAVGASQFMESTNGGYAIYDKSTGQQKALISDGTFWTAAGRTEGTYPNGLLLNKAQSWITGYNSNLEGHEYGHTRYNIFATGGAEYAKHLKAAAEGSYRGISFS